MLLLDTIPPGYPTPPVTLPPRYPTPCIPYPQGRDMGPEIPYTTPHPRSPPTEDDTEIPYPQKGHGTSDQEVTWGQ